MRGTNLHGLSAAFLPIAAVPVFIAWQNSAYQVVQGFRAMALSGQGGLASVTEIILASKLGHLSSLSILVFVFLAGIFVLRKKPRATAPLASRPRTLVMMGLAVTCIAERGLPPSLELLPSCCLCRSSYQPTCYTTQAHQ